MNCQKCGLQIDNGAKFCGSCGTPVAASQPQQSVPPVASTPANGSLGGVSQPTQNIPTQQPAGMNQASPASAPQATPATQAVPVQPAYNQPAPSSGAATGSLVTGILSLPGSLIPIVGTALAVSAIVLSKKSKRAGITNSKTTAGMVLGIIGVVLSIIFFILGLIVILMEEEELLSLLRSLLF